jgi:hypothetical protein
MIYRDDIPNSVNIHSVAALGHANPMGGGSLNSFGKDFRAHKYKWTKELCELDSDGDGKTNGEELGDPCCSWLPGQIPSRVWAISHPGDVYKTTYLARDPVACAAEEKRARRKGAEKDEEFWKFYFTVDSNSLNKLSVETQAAELVLKKQSVAKRACNNDPNTCGHCSETNACETCAGRREVPCTSRKRKDLFYQEMGGINQGQHCTFGGSCTQCSFSKAGGFVSCRCAQPNGQLSWSICQYSQCFSRGVGISNNVHGKLACNSGLNYCLASPDYDARVKVLEQDPRTSGSIPAHDEEMRRMSEDPESYLETTFKTNEHAENNPRNLPTVGFAGTRTSASQLLGDTHTISTALTIVLTGMFMYLERASFTSWKGATSASSLSMLAASVVYVDFLSGLLHITLDNPTITHWPLIGPECIAFQGHHVTPNGEEMYPVYHAFYTIPSLTCVLHYTITDMRSTLYHH